MSNIQDVFRFYHEYVKPLYCEIEARDNSLPVELLFEIHAAFDHLKRHHVEGEDQDTCCNRAISHLKRGSLDAFKLKLKYFHEDIECLKNADLSLIDNGTFYPNLLKDKNAIVTLAKDARLKEGNPDPNLAFELWSATSINIDEFYEKYINRQESIEWAKGKTFSWINKDSLRGFAIGLLSGGLSSYLIWWLTR